MYGTGIQFTVYVRLPIISDKYKAYEMWFLKEGLGGAVRVLVYRRRPAGFRESGLSLCSLGVLFLSKKEPG
jgi:hypothetical protein